MRLVPRSLKMTCVMTLVHNYRYINLTILPHELSTEIMSAIRDSHYGEQKVTTRRLADPHNNRDAFRHHDRVVEYLFCRDPQNPILRYHLPGTAMYDLFFRATSKDQTRGMIHDVSHDCIVEADYRHTVETYLCYLEENLPLPLISQLEEEHIISEPILVPISTIKSRW